MKSARRPKTRSNRLHRKPRSARARSIEQQKFVFEKLESRQLLATAGLMTFDPGISGPLPSYSENGMTVTPVNVGDHVILSDATADGDEELLLTPYKGYGPYEFRLDSGAAFTLNSIELDRFEGILVLMSSSGAVYEGLATGVLALPNTGWSGITSFTMDASFYAHIDDVSFESGTIAGDDQVEIPEDSPEFSIDVLANDGVNEGGTLAIVSNSTPANGTADIVDGEIVYMPNPDFFGTDTFTYDISDGLGGIDTATVTVTVGPINDAPVVDLNGTAAGISFMSMFTGSTTEIADSDATVVDIDGGIATLDETIYVVNRSGQIIAIDSVTGDQTPVGNSGTLINRPGKLVVDPATGLIYVVNKGPGSAKVIQVDPATGIETSIALYGSGSIETGGITIDANGDLIVNYLVSKPRQGYILRIDPSTGAQSPIASSNQFDTAGGLAVEADGSILQTARSVLHRIDPVTGAVTTLSTGGVVTRPHDVDVDANGKIFVMGYGLGTGDSIVEVNPATGSQTLLAITSRDQTALAINNSGDPVFIQSRKTGEIVKVDAGNGNLTSISQGHLLWGGSGIDLIGGTTAGDIITSLTVEITNRQDGTSEVLAANVSGTNISADYDSGTGILSLTGADTAATYEAVLRTITYDNTAVIPNTTPRLLDVVVSDGVDNSEVAVAVIVWNRPPVVEDQSFDVAENETAVGSVVASDSDTGDTLTYSITGGADAVLFDIDPSTGELFFLNAPDYETPLDDGGDNIYDLIVTVTDDAGASDSGNMQVTVLNQASIMGSVFVDVNGDGLMQANEPGIDGVVVQLLDEFGAAVLDDSLVPITATTSDGGIYLFEDLNPNIYQVHEVQPTGVDDGSEILGTILGSVSGSVLPNDTMQLTLARDDAFDYAFAELGQEVTSGDTATIGFWQNKHGQSLINEGGADLADWLSSNFTNVFGNTFDTMSVADFYKQQLFKRKAVKGSGPAKVDAQFMATALATYFTSSNLSGDNVAASFGFNVSATGIGTNVVNVGSNGTAFGVGDGTDVTIMQLLLATNDLTVNDCSGATSIYDCDGDGEISPQEAALRDMANTVYSWINEAGDI